jgi:2-(1,2-epoxy-1,2-dihydrophenyl)acetyl-CoA isomerase
MDSPEAAVLLDEDGGVLTITLHAPQVRNALTPAIEAGLERGIHQANQPRVRAVVVTGNGPAFCAGANTKELDSNDERDAATLRMRAREIPEGLLLPLVRLEKPVIAAINGPVAGAGIGIALAADYRICATSASFVFAFKRLGLAPDLGIGWTLPRLIGYRAARDVLLGGTTMTADEARTLGLADDVVPDADLASTAADLARELAEGPTMALGATKTLLRYGSELSLEQFLSQEVLFQSGLVRSEDHLEGVSALSERRTPQFRGR